jgi:hypothetical protein
VGWLCGKATKPTDYYRPDAFGPADQNKGCRLWVSTKDYTLAARVTGLASHSAGTSVSVCPMGDEGRAVWAFKPFTGWDGAMHTLVFIQVLHVAAAKMGKIPVGA